MKSKWWKYACIGMLLFDLCLFSIKGEPGLGKEKGVQSGTMDGHQTLLLDVSNVSISSKTVQAGNLAMVAMLMAMTFL